MRVVLVLEYPTLNGGERSLLAALPTALAKGCEVAAVAPAAGPLAAALAGLGLRVRPFDFADGAGVRRPLETLRRELAEVFRAAAPSLVHANSLSAARLAGPVCRELRIPSIGHLRDIVRLSAAAVADLNCHTRLLAVSQATAQYHVAQGLDARRLQVAYNGVDLQTFCPREPTGWLHRELRLPPTALLVGNVGQLVMRKGQDVLAAAARDVATALPLAHFVFVGARYSRKDEALQYERDVRAAFECPPLMGRGHFLGTRDDVAELLPEWTALVHAARQEPLGRVLLEAAAAGVPIVATDTGGTREILGDDGDGARLVPTGDAAALAAALVQSLTDPHTARRRAARARERIKRQFDVRTAAEELWRHYRETAASGVPAA